VVIGALIATSFSGSTSDYLTIAPPAEPTPARVVTYEDHRMAMSLALVGLNIPDVVIHDPDCTAKTYPSYFRDLHRLVHGTDVSE